MEKNQKGPQRYAAILSLSMCQFVTESKRPGNIRTFMAMLYVPSRLLYEQMGNAMFQSLSKIVTPKFLCSMVNDLVIHL